MKRQHTLPTLLGLFILIVTSAVGVFAVQTRQTLQTSADTDSTPKQVRITNITSDSFTVSWVTTKKTSGFVNFGKSDSLGETISGSPLPSQTHWTVVSNLSTSTKYLFKIVSEANTFDNNGQAYTLKTGPKLALPAKTDVVFGTVLTASGAPSAGTIVYLTLPGASPLSVLTDNKGSYVFPISYSKSTNLEILAQAANMTASAKIPLIGARPVPPLTLGKSYNFTDVKSPQDASSLPNSSIELANAQSLTPVTTPKASTITLTPTPWPTSTPTPPPTLVPQPITNHPLPTTLPQAWDLTPALLLTIMGLSSLSAGFLLGKLAKTA